MRALIVFLAAIVVSGCVNTMEREANRYTSITKEEAFDLITVRDDSLETRAEINTQDVFKAKSGLLGLTWDDNFLRAYIDKQTGHVTYQVYDRIYMKEWSYFYQVNYSSPSGTQTKDVVRVASDVESCSSNQFIGCTLREDVAWSIDRELLNEVAELYVPGQATGWKYKLKAKSGDGQTRALTAAEVVALLMAVDNYRELNKLPYSDKTQTRKPTRAADPKTREFGKQSIAAEEAAQKLGCKSSDRGRAVGDMIINDYGTETYQFHCADETMLIRCEFNNCRQL